MRALVPLWWGKSDLGAFNFNYKIKIGFRKNWNQIVKPNKMTSVK